MKNLELGGNTKGADVLAATERSERAVERASGEAASWAPQAPRYRRSAEPTDTLREARRSKDRSELETRTK